MEIEFHYYMMYLVATKAKMSPDDARVLAYASQYTDDNDLSLEIDQDKSSYYKSYMSQTVDILKPRTSLFRIYAIFHFVPGRPEAPSAFRKDGLLYWLNTTPDSDNARTMLTEALGTGDPHRIGIACHAYADTFAHQNFAGYFSMFNGLAGPLEKVLPDIGHADAKHAPDWPALVWTDKRLKKEIVDNKSRFLDAAEALLRWLARSVSPGLIEATLDTWAAELRRDLGWAIGDRDDANRLRKSRIARYKELALRPDYGGVALPDYDEEQWFDEAVNEDVRGLRDRKNILPLETTLFHDIYTWKSAGAYQQTHWYLFQEAVKAHQAFMLGLLGKTNLQGIALPGF